MNLSVIINHLVHNRQRAAPAPASSQTQASRLELTNVAEKPWCGNRLQGIGRIYLNFVKTPHLESKTLRRLGGLERWFYAMDLYRPNHFSIAATLDGVLEPDLLRRSLVALQQRHPLLNATVQSDGSSIIAFTRAEPATLPLRILIRHKDDQWREEIMKEGASHVNPSVAPLMRVVLIQGVDRSDLVLAFPAH
jgi:hypothetical protein